jgi:hypothetical protein
MSYIKTISPLITRLSSSSRQFRPVLPQLSLQLRRYYDSRPPRRESSARSPPETKWTKPPRSTVRNPSAPVYVRESPVSFNARRSFSSDNRHLENTEPGLHNNAKQELSFNRQALPRETPIRSLFYVPGSSLKMLEKAKTIDADLIVHPIQTMTYTRLSI